MLVLATEVEMWLKKAQKIHKINTKKLFVKYQLHVDIRDIHFEMSQFNDKVNVRLYFKETENL